MENMGKKEDFRQIVQKRKKYLPPTQPAFEWEGCMEDPCRSREAKRITMQGKIYV